MTSDDFLHLCQSVVACDCKLLTKITDRLGINLALMCSLGTHTVDLLLLLTDVIVLLVEHLLLDLDSLVSSISHFLLSLL